MQHQDWTMRRRGQLWVCSCLPFYSSAFWGFVSNDCWSNNMVNSRSTGQAWTPSAVLCVNTWSMCITVSLSFCSAVGVPSYYPVMWKPDFKPTGTDFVCRNSFTALFFLFEGFVCSAVGKCQHISWSSHRTVIRRAFCLCSLELERGVEAKTERDRETC